MDERVRRLPGKGKAWQNQVWMGPLQSGSSTLSGHQRTVSEGHPFSRLGKVNEDLGGNFRTDKVRPTSPITVVDLSRGSSTYWYKGPIFTSPSFREMFDVGYEIQWETDSPALHPSLLDARGATLISRCIPTNPVADASSFLGELREGLPSIPTKSMFTKPSSGKAGGEYLNMEFGIKPILSDLKKFRHAHEKSEKILAQLERDSGKNVRRRRSFPVEETVENSTFWGPIIGPKDAYIDPYLITGGTVTRTVKTKRRIWFSGAFTYYLPEKEGWRKTIAEMDMLYGVIPDAATFYQLTPWSWLADWVANYGDVISNLRSFSEDGLVLRYGYVMCHTTREVTETWQGKVPVQGDYMPLTFSNSYTWETKQRQKATPYGFGLNLDSLSGRQLAILAALGLSQRR